MVEGEKLRNRRKYYIGISQSKLAERVGVSERTIRYMENDKIKCPSHDVARKLAKELKTTEAWIYGEETEDTGNKGDSTESGEYSVHVVKDTRNDPAFTEMVGRHYVDAKPANQAAARITLEIPEPPET